MEVVEESYAYTRLCYSGLMFDDAGCSLCGPLLGEKNLPEFGYTSSDIIWFLFDLINTSKCWSNHSNVNMMAIILSVFFPTLLIVRCVGGWVLTTHWLNIFLGLWNTLCSDRPFRYSIYSEFIGFPAQLNKQFNCWCLEWGSVSVGIQIHSIYTFTLYRKAFIDESGDHSLYWILNACQASLKKTIEII